MLLGASGSVAAIKFAELARLLVVFADVKFVATKAARHFIQEADLPLAAGPVHGNNHNIHLPLQLCVLPQKHIINVRRALCDVNCLPSSSALYSRFTVPFFVCCALLLEAHVIFDLSCRR